MSDIFLSYARGDVLVAEKLARLLENSGLDVWWDRRLLAGDDFNAEIEKALTDAGCVVVLWSPLSVDSKWVRGEAQRALDLDKLVPIMIAPCQLPINFGQIHTPQVYLSAAQLTDLAHQLTRRLKGPSSAGPESSRSSAKPRPAGSDEVVFAPSAAHTFFEDLKALQQDPGRTWRERTAKNTALWRKHPMKMSLYVAGIALLFGAVGAMFQAYQFYYGNCPASSAQWVGVIQLSVAQATRQYAVDGDATAYRARLQDADDALRWTPRQCLLSLPVDWPDASQASACPQRWSAYAQCLEQRKKDIVAGRPLPLCTEPACPRH
ncbi:MAG: toll/interleukin-1 receptor domain-containing protein [Rubrivivax sp.]|nr:toll/interleukin-1 receptor domain-containing protein [Rubrivivax sp.]